MESLRENYDRIVNERKSIIDELKVLEENDKIKKYFELTKKNDELYKIERDLYAEIRKEEFKKCNHVLIYSKSIYDELEQRTYRYRGCIKCGLDESVKADDNYKFSSVTKAMHDCLGWVNIKGKYIDYVCDLELARAIYNRIKEVHPDINDETAIKYFEIALDNIRNIKVSEERKEKRANRLCLRKGFNNWN